MKRLFIAFVTAAAFVAGLWYFAVPEDALVRLIENSLQGSGVRLRVEGLKKGPFYNFSAARITLSRSDAVLLYADDVGCRLNPLELFLLRLSISVKGEVSGGSVNGLIGLLKGKTYADISIEGADMEGLPFLSFAGMQGKGNFSGSLRLKDSSGDIKFTMRDIALKPGTFGGVLIPLDMFQKAQGAMSLSGDTISIVSFSFEGNGIYARIKGEIKEGRRDLVMELMPDRTFLDNNPVFQSLENYKTSPGYYSIPIKGPVTF